MKLVLQIAAGIVIGSLVFWGGCVLLLSSAADQVAKEQHRAADKAMKEFQRAAADPDPWGLRRKLAQKDAARAREQVLRSQSSQLQPGQSCLGGFNGQPGTIIVRGVDGHSVAQLIENGRPVQCVGNQRLN